MNVTASKPVKGTVNFSAEDGGAPVEGVEVRIDGNPKGSTDAEGKLGVEWLLAGPHSWQAFQNGMEVSHGKLKIAEITDVEYLGTWCELEGREDEKLYQW